MEDYTSCPVVCQP